MRKSVVHADSFESELIAELVRQRFSYKVIHHYLKLCSLNHPKRDQSLRYHANKHDVSLTRARHDIHAVQRVAQSIPRQKERRVKHG